MMAKSPDGMTNLEVREVIIRDIASALSDHKLMDLFGQEPRIVGTYSTLGGDVWLEIDYGGGHTYHLAVRRFTRWTTMYARRI